MYDTNCNMCKESIFVPNAENKSIFSRLRKWFAFKKSTTTTITSTSAHRLSSVSSSGSDSTTTTDLRISVISSGGSSNNELERVFMYFDENGDGKVSPTELRRCVKAVGGELTEEEAEMAVRLSDSDRDGLLGLEDFTKLMEGLEEESKLFGTFEMYEEKEEGYITPKSLKRMLSRLGESTSIDKCKVMIRRFDLNGDGVLSFDEFKIMMTN